MNYYHDEINIISIIGNLIDITHINQDSILQLCDIITIYRSQYANICRQYYTNHEYIMYRSKMDFHWNKLWLHVLYTYQADQLLIT